MDKLEQKLRAYNEYNPVEISDEFLQRLKALEPRPAAARKPRRYVLPIAAALAVALGLTGWAILRAARPDEPQASPPAVTLEEPFAQIPDNPAIPSKPASPEKKDPAPPAPKAESEPIPEAPVSLTKPGQDGTAQPAPEDTAPAKPEDTAPAKPEDTAPAKPEDTTPVKPEDTTPVKPEDTTSGKPNDPPPAAEPSKTDDAAGAASEENAQESSPQTPPNISAYCRMAGGRETLILTLLSTGECVEIDVSGLAPAIADDSQGSAGEGSPGDAAAANQAGGAPYFGACSAFGWQIVYVLARSVDGTVYAQIVDVRQN